MKSKLRPHLHGPPSTQESFLCRCGRGDYQTKGIACAVKLFGWPCLVTSSDVDCKKPFIMDRYSRFYSGRKDYRLDSSSIINCKTFGRFSFLMLNEDITRREQCIFELPLKLRSREQGTFHVQGFGKSFPLQDPKQRKLDLGSPTVQTTVTGNKNEPSCGWSRRIERQERTLSNFHRERNFG